MSFASTHTRHAAEWGLAALVLASVAALIALGTVLFGTFYAASFHPLRPSRTDVRVTVLFPCLLAVLFFGLGVTGVVFGSVGLRSVSRRGQPAGLPLAGILLSAVVVALWLAVSVGLVMEAADLLRT